MIIIKPNECILKPKVTLYNNLARSGRCKGRLLVELEIYPSPRVVWEFESLGNTACEPKGSSSRLLENPFIGNRFRMDRPYVTNLSWGTLTGSPRIALIGFSPRISLGENEFKGHSFTFLLPNAKYQEQNYFGQTNLINVLKVGQGEDAKEIIEDLGGKSITFPIDNYWQIHLETRKDALTWLENKQRNTGTLLTTIGRLSPQVWENKPSRRVAISMDDAISRLHTFSLLLSFANGGYIGPLYVEGYYHGRTRKFLATVMAYRITPLEQLGSTWLTSQSDIIGYLRCLETLERMSDLPLWIDEFDLILSWYFQAIQPQNIQMQKPWPVVANALGAAMERLNYIIVENELNMGGASSLARRISRLLDRTGIISGGGSSNIKLIDDFVDIRNDATHPRRRSTVSSRGRDYVLDNAIQWVEEILLWRLGYNGKYRNRNVDHYSSMDPRYDLSLRDSSW